MVVWLVLNILFNKFMEENKEKINLESKSWYRALKVLGIGLLVFSFLLLYLLRVINILLMLYG